MDLQQYPSDEFLAIFVPIVVYWVYSGMYMMLGSLDQYRLHPREDEEKKNLVPKREVVKGVLLQQLVQSAVACLVFMVNLSNIMRLSCTLTVLIIKLTYI